jgi:alpha-1,3-rhamnosyl/mannosyltransferase
LRALGETIGGDEELIETHRPRGADVFHAPHMASAMLHCPVPMVVTLHDLTALRRRSEYLRTGVRLRLRHLAVQRAMRVIVSSETVARDAYEGLGIEPDRVAVIHEAPDPRLYERSQAEVALAKEQFGLPDSYLLWVGGLRHPDPGKHLTKLAATPRELPLVLVGPTRPWAHELPNVILTGEVSDEQLAAIYSGAHALLLPSHQDVSALAALEALACGTPVVACENPVLREVVSERATFVEAGDMRALIVAGQAVARPAPGPPAWSWQDAARMTWGVYRQAMACVDGPRTTARQLRLSPPRGMGSSVTRPQ